MRSLLALLLILAVSAPPWLHSVAAPLGQMTLSGDAAHHTHHGHDTATAEHAAPFGHLPANGDLAQQQQLCLTACACLPAPLSDPIGLRAFGTRAKLVVEPQLDVCGAGSGGPFRPPKHSS